MAKAPKAPKNNRDAAIAELVALMQKLAPFAGDIKRFEALKKQVRQWADDDKIAATTAALYTAAAGTITLGPKENERKFRPGALLAIFKRLGETKFLATCSLTLKAATEALGETALGEFILEERTGSRPITIIAAPQTPAKAA